MVPKLLLAVTYVEMISDVLINPISYALIIIWNLSLRSSDAISFPLRLYFSPFINDIIVYFIFKKGVTVNRRRWEISNPRPFYWNFVGLTARLLPHYFLHRILTLMDIVHTKTNFGNPFIIFTLFRTDEVTWTTTTTSFLAVKAVSCVFGIIFARDIRVTWDDVIFCLSSLVRWCDVWLASLTQRATQNGLS